MTRSGWDGIAADTLNAVVAANQIRQPRDLDGGSPNTVLSKTGQSVVSFASNDYLGLTQHPAVRAAARGAIDACGTGSGSARLIVGSRPVHSRPEERIAAFWDRARQATIRGTIAALTNNDRFSRPEPELPSHPANPTQPVDAANAKTTGDTPNGVDPVDSGTDDAAAVAATAQQA